MHWYMRTLKQKIGGDDLLIHVRRLGSNFACESRSVNEFYAGRLAERRRDSIENDRNASDRFGDGSMSGEPKYSMKAHTKYRACLGVVRSNCS